MLPGAHLDPPTQEETIQVRFLKSNVPWGPQMTALGVFCTQTATEDCFMTNLPLQSLSEVPGSPRKPEPPKGRGKRGTRDAVKRVSLPGMWRLPAKSPETTPSSHIFT